MSSQKEKIIREFTKQAETFNGYQKSFSKEDITRFALSHMHLTGSESVLEAAAGTCAFGRTIAPHVSHVTEYDVTEAMLEVGRQEALKQGIGNVSFVQGEAERLPFDDGSFDLVVSRLAFHHFEDPGAVMSEMVRVLRAGGRNVIIDMRARDESLRETADSIERLRDPSHVRCLSGEEFGDLAGRFGLSVSFCDTIHVPVELDAWMDVTKVEGSDREKIRKLMEDDIAGGDKTGFEPYIKDGKIMFDHRWMVMICEK